MKNWQRYVAPTAVHILDEAAARVGDGEKAVHHLAAQWRGLADDDKRELIELGLAIVAAIGVAVTSAEKPKKKKKARKKVEKLARKAGAKVLKKAAVKPVKKAKRK